MITVPIGFILFALIATIPLIFIGCFLIWRYEKRRYNNGYCSCGGRWIHHDYDSQCGDGWKCERCGRGFWSSWIRPKNVYYGEIK